MADLYNQLSDWFLRDGLAAAVFSIAGFVLALFMVARLVGEKRAPANTFAWILVVVLLPWVGVPLYLLIGGRKLRKIAEKKTPVAPRLPQGAEPTQTPCDSPIAHTIVSAGGTPPVPGNTLRLLTNGEDAYAALEEQIRNAKSHIHITTFILSRDDTGRRIVKLLAQKAREGVKVRLLLDFVGSLLSTSTFVQPIRKAGGQVATFMPVIPFTPRGSANLRSHRKIAIFDHCTAIVGGHNLAKEYMGPTRFARRWQDFGAVVEGPAASLLNEVFIQDWCFATGENTETLRTEIPPTAAAKVRGETELQVVASGPDVPGDPLYEGIVSMIQEARESIWIVTPYFIPDDVLMRSLIVKARAGRDVTLILPRRSDHPIVDLARRHFVRELRKAGARVLLFGPGMMHSKAMIIDDNLALFGSANFDLRSLFVNFEIGVVVHTPADVREIKYWATALTYRSHPPKPDRKRRTRVVGRIAEEISRLMAPLL